MDKDVKVEFAVEMTCRKCEEAISSALRDKPGISAYAVDLANEKVVIQGTLPSYELKSLIESTGRRAVLQGIGGTTSAAPRHMGAAVAEIAGRGIQGVLRFVQTDEHTCVIEGTVDGLSPGSHGINIHEFGDLSDACKRCGDHYNPFNKPHGSPVDKERHVGDLGNITVDSTGRSTFRLQDDQVRVWGVIGRSIVIHESADDLGRGSTPFSLITGNSGPGVACGIIARSAGLFQNAKRLCTCDGVSLWDERDVPVVGAQRQNKQRSS